MYQHELHDHLIITTVFFVATATKTFNLLQSKPHLHLGHGTGT